MLAKTFFNGLMVLLGFSTVTSGNIYVSLIKVNVTISVNLPPNGLICVDKNITFMCHAPTQHNLHIVGKQYVWLINGGKLEIRGRKYTMWVPLQSPIKVYCEVTVKLSNGTAFIGDSSITVRDRLNGTAPQIHLQDVTNNFVIKYSRSPFNLTATVVSDLNLTSLDWSPPEFVGPLPNKIITVHHGNIVTVTFMLLKDASLGDSGNYTLTAVNECGQSSLKVDVKVLTDDRVYLTLIMTNSAGDLLNGLICVDQTIIIISNVLNNITHITSIQYQWSIDGGKRKIGNDTYTIQAPSHIQSTITVSCEVFIKLHSGVAVFGRNSIIIQPSDSAIPQIHFQDVTNNFVYKFTGIPFNLTATVVSKFNLTSVYWSPPEHVGPLPNRTVTVHSGNMTTTTFMLLKDASLNDSGNYTLTAVNKCTQNSSQVHIDVNCGCPPIKLRKIQHRNFTAVEGYNTTLKYSFDGCYLHLRMRVLHPHSQTPVSLDNQFYHVEHQLACCDGTNQSDCCIFEFIVHSRPHFNESGTAFSYRNFSNEDTVWMIVLPSPKVIGLPHNVITTVGSKAVFTCDFEAATDNKIAQIHWLFNGNDLAGCNKVNNCINCMVTKQINGTNVITSTLTIYPVQTNNAGQYTCYCSYNTSLLNVDGVQVIKSDYKSATLSIPPSAESNEKLHLIIGISVGIFMITFVVIIVLKLIHCKFYRNKGIDYVRFDLAEEDEITDEELDQYIVEELFPFWEKLGKALKLPGCFLDDTYNDYPADPAERLRVILREWRAKADHPSLTMLDKRLEQFGIQKLDPTNLAYSN